MSTYAEIHNRERMGWIVLLVSFSFFVAIAVSIPLLLNNYLQNAMVPLATAVQANQGTVGIDDPEGLRRAASVGQSAVDIAASSTVLTDATATALLTVAQPNSEQTLARLQVYGNTTLRLNQADTPRFNMSDNSRTLRLALENGRLRLVVPDFDGRSFLAQINTPHGEIDITQPGQYSIEVMNAETQVAVQSGQAAIVAAASPILLLAGERAVIPIDGKPQGPLTTERNLIRNGDFSQSLSQWSLFAWAVERADQPKGKTEVLPIAGVPTLKVVRSGSGHADVKIRQTLNQDVTDYQSLRLLLTFRIINQSLGVCGTLGSECPLFIKLNYIDQNGTSRIWQHGFYAEGTVNQETSPDGCISCAVVQSAHERVAMDQIKFYDVSVLEELARQGALPPRFIESVEMAFLGHSFEVEVMDVSMIAEE